MKKFLILTGVFFIYSFQALLATDVSGIITTNTIWNLAGSPYIVTSFITVNHGVELTVEPGVTVKFNDGQFMLVNGSMVASGSTFTSNNAAPVPGIWSYIQTGGSTPTDVGTVTMNGCQVLYASTFNVYRGKANLTNTNLINFYSNGVDVQENGRLKMTGGSINTTSANAATNCSGIGGNSGSYDTISGVTIQHFQYGISLQLNATFDLANTIITSCNWPVYYHNSANLSAHGINIFTGNVNTAVCMGFFDFSDTLRLPRLPIPYYFPNTLTVNTGGMLEIDSENILKFPDGTGLQISGALVANANVGENIFFTSWTDDNWGGDTNNDGTATAPSSGNWNGIRFQDPANDATCLMRRCKVRYAGAGHTGGISMFNAGPTVDLCELSNNYYGVYMQYASNPLFSNNTIGSSQFTPIAMSFEANPTMPDNILSFSDNAYDAIGLIGGTLSADAEIIKRSVTTVQNITYLLLDQIIVPAGKSLTVNKGIVIKSYSYAHRIIVDGTLNAIATADSMITFTSSKDDNYGNPGDCNKDGTITSPAIGDWGGIVFNPGSTGTLDYCRIKYATNWYYDFSTCSATEYLIDAGVGMIDASPVITNCEFKDLNYGISCYSGSNPILSNNNMINITYTPFCISVSSDPVFTGNTFTNIGLKALGLLGGNVCLNGTIKKRNVAGYSNITYVLLADMTINSETFVNVEPGVVIKSKQYFNGSCGVYNGYNINIDGGFRADGLTGQHVVFTSIKDDNTGNPFDTNGDGNASTPAAGDWGCIKYRSSSDDGYSLLNYADIKYAGFFICNESVGGVVFENAGGQLKNAVIINSRYGVYCNGNSTPAIDNVSIRNCSLDPIAMSLTSDPTFSNITFVSNFSQAIKIIEGTLATSATLVPRNVAGITNIAYVVDKLIISADAKLTIQPGVVIKFRVDTGPWYSNILVNGNLIANGTPSQKIYFTSFADDSRGGDSNNNGNTTSPFKGDWGSGYSPYTNVWDPYPGGILIVNNDVNSDTVNSFNYCEISYAATGMRLENAHATLENSIIQQAQYYGAAIVGSSNPEINNCQFYNITFSPIELSMFSTPSFTSCTALNAGYMAISVIPETYSQSATIPVRNFGGYENITYFMEGVCTINSGTTITIPEGIVFKSSDMSNNGSNYYNTNSIANGFDVNGRLDIQGTSINPVVFTNDKDDNYGNPPDMNQDGSASQPPDGFSWNQAWSGSWLTFNDVSDDLSSSNHVICKYGDKGIATLNASPVIGHIRFEKLYYGVDMNGVSAPVMDDCLFHDLKYYPMQISLVSYPVSSSNSIISGTTYKVIKVRDETLTQDVTLQKRSFGGIANIPYYFENYTIGTGASLTIDPGVVCKFKAKTPMEGVVGIHILKGLTATGGFSPDSNIVFTSIRDDFYGGDSNADSTATTPSIYDWDGLVFEDESLDPLCNLKNCILRYADKAITTTSASPFLENCNINNNNYGVYAAAASNPVFNQCDFNDNYYFALANVDKSFVINAANCWWGSNLGPVQTNTPGNGTSVQELITTSVDYQPFKTNGGVSPVMGDVSLNGAVQAFDASLVLQHVVGSITLNVTQQEVADVSAEAGITAYDASLILQYVVGMIQYFPAELLKSGVSFLSDPVLSVGSAAVMSKTDVDIPVRVIHESGMVSGDIYLKYDPDYLQVKRVTTALTGMTMFYGIDSINGILTIALAGTCPLAMDTTLALITFHARCPAGTQVSIPVRVNTFLANETDLTNGSINGIVTITNPANGIAPETENMPGRMFPVYPNPTSGNATLTYVVNKNHSFVTIGIYNMTGQKVATLINGQLDKGKYTVSVLKQGIIPDSGAYLIRMTVNGYSQTQILQIAK